MKNYGLIGLICCGAIDKGIIMTTTEIIKLAEYLEAHGVEFENNVRCNVVTFPPWKPLEMEFEIKDEIEDEPAINNPVEELGISKKNREKLRHATMDDIIKTKPVKKVNTAQQSETDKRMTDAYLGEHPNIQPAPVEKKPLSPREQQLWDYMQSHPDSRMPKTCEDLGITNVNYYFLKQQLKKKGWITSAVENVKEVEL